MDNVWLRNHNKTKFFTIICYWKIYYIIFLKYVLYLMHHNCSSWNTLLYKKVKINEIEAVRGKDKWQRIVLEGSIVNQDDKDPL